MWAPFKKLAKKQKGFTIIEVMIVLAVAALIMLIVFLAVPALQRNAANNQRLNDASKIAGGVNECLSNRNDTPKSCDTNTEIVGTTLDTATLQKLTTVTMHASTLSPSAFPTDTKTAWVYYNTSCSADGSSYQSSNANNFVVLFNVESSSGGNINRCVGG